MDAQLWELVKSEVKENEYFECIREKFLQNMPDESASFVKKEEYADDMFKEAIVLNESYETFPLKCIVYYENLGNGNLLWYFNEYQDDDDYVEEGEYESA